MNEIICPQCQNEMKKHWGGSWFRGGNIESWRCDPCEMVFLQAIGEDGKFQARLIPKDVDQEMICSSFEECVRIWKLRSFE